MLNLKAAEYPKVRTLAKPTNPFIRYKAGLVGSEYFKSRMISPERSIR
jgi:hypothetical protein